MPASGEQHKSALGSGNPFDEPPTRISEYTALEIATLQSRLEKQLGPEFIAARQGPSGQKVHYVPAEKCINLANEVFGFNGWSSSIRDIQIDFVDESVSTGKITLGLSVIVRVTLRDGTYHEDIGYGHIENCKGKAAAFEKAKKEGTTDGLKRTLRNFGNVLGNCVYDKDYVQRVTRIKVAPSKWNAANLHRHSDYALVKKEAQDGSEKPTSDELSHSMEDDEFGVPDFDEVDLAVPHDDHPDEIAIDSDRHFANIRKEAASPSKSGQNQAANQVPQEPLPNNRPPPQRVQSMSNGGAIRPPHALVSHVARKGPPAAGNSGSPAAVGKSATAAKTGLLQQQPNDQQVTTSCQPSAQRAPIISGPGRPVPQHQQYQPSRNSEHNLPALQSHDYRPPPPGEPPLGFFTARAAEYLQSGSKAPNALPSFDPKFESTSLRRTAGIDHSKTDKIKREVIGQPPAPVPQPGRATNFVNPSADPSRKIGVPNAAQSPMQNRGQYRPPVKRAADSATITPGPTEAVRSVLNDVTNLASNAEPADRGGGGDAKRQRLSAGAGEVGIS